MITTTYTEFRNRTGKYLQAVERGETVEVQKRGKPVAVLSPARQSASDYWKHVRPLPIRLPKGVSATKLLLQEREESL